MWNTLQGKLLHPLLVRKWEKRTAMSCRVFFMIPATIWSQQSRGIARVWSPPPKPVCAPREEGWHPFQTKVLAGPDILGFDLQTHALWFHSVSERLFIYLFVCCHWCHPPLSATAVNAEPGNASPNSTCPGRQVTFAGVPGCAQGEG